MSYQLKEGETWDGEATTHPPKFCPECGAAGLKTQGYWADSSRPSSSENPFRGIGFDCFCAKCKWSGNIESDLDSNIIDEAHRGKEEG